MKKFFNNAINNPVSISVLALFEIFLIWWIWLHYFISGTSANTLLLWSDVYQLVALFGAIFGFIASNRWGGSKSFIGRAIIAFSIGLFFQTFGQSVFAYYVHYLQVSIPYPSIADVGFFGSILFYLYGALMLAKVSHAKPLLKLIGSRIYIILIPLGILAISYFIILQGYIFNWYNPIKIFLDFGYSLVEIVSLSIVLLAFSLSQQKLRGALKIPIISFIVALACQYLSDFVFTYQANIGTYSAGGINDLMYLFSYILMAFSLILLSLWPSILPD